jgi:hypothetical protein
MRPGGNAPNVSWNSVTAKPTWRRLLWHCIRRADSRAFCIAGNNKPAKTPMMAITVKSSIKVNPRLVVEFVIMLNLNPKALYPSNKIHRKAVDDASILIHVERKTTTN